MYYTGGLELDLDFDSIDHLLKALRPYELLRSAMQKHSKYGLLTAIDATRGACATDLRDRVYGLLGMINHWESAELKPDYAVPLWQVYTHATRVSIAKTGSLDIPHLAGTSQKAISNLPSWAADFIQAAHKLQYATHDSWDQREHLPGLPGFPVRGLWDASRSLPPLPYSPAPPLEPDLVVTREDDIRQLRSKAVDLGRIIAVLLLQKAREEAKTLRITTPSEYRRIYGSAAVALASFLERAKQGLLVSQNRVENARRLPSATWLGVRLSTANSSLIKSELLRMGRLVLWPLRS